MKQTAVEWLIEQLKINNYISENAHWLIDDAKQMEMYQIQNAFNDGFDERKSGEEYYNEKFNKNEIKR